MTSYPMSILIKNIIERGQITFMS